MFQEFYANSGMLNWPIMGIGILLATFVAVVFWVVFGLKESPTVSRMAHLPLEEELIVEATEEVGTHE